MTDFCRLDIERIVREVLAELGLSPRAGAARCAATTMPPKRSAPSGPPVDQPLPPARAAGDCGRRRRVVTLAGRRGRLDARPPAGGSAEGGGDAGRSRRIAAAERGSGRRRHAEADCRPRQIGRRWSLAVARSIRRPLVDALARRGDDGRSATFDCLIAATDRLAAKLSQPGTAGVLSDATRSRRHVPGEPASGRSGRPGVGRRRDGGATPLSVGANLLVVDPRRTEPVEAMRQIVDGSFARRAECPGECARQRVVGQRDWR